MPLREVTRVGCLSGRARQSFSRTASYHELK